MSKGSKPRPVDRKVFNREHDRIFEKLGECNRLEAEVVRVKGEIEDNVSGYLAKFGLVQTKNPRSGRYVKIDGSTVVGKQSDGPYKNIPLAKPHQGKVP